MAKPVYPHEMLDAAARRMLFDIQPGVISVTIEPLFPRYRRTMEAPELIIVKGFSAQFAQHVASEHAQRGEA